MNLVRHFIRDHRMLAAVSMALALIMKITMPAGTMPGWDASTLTIQICADGTGGRMTTQITIPASGKTQTGKGDHVASQGLCPFSVLASGMISATDPPLLLITLAWALILRPLPARAPPHSRPIHFRPPLRGPPAYP